MKSINPLSVFVQENILINLILFALNKSQGIQSLRWKYIFQYTLAANVMESLLINGICVNCIGIYCFWSYVQLRNEILLISSIHYITKLDGQTQSVLSWDR